MIFLLCIMRYLKKGTKNHFNRKSFYINFFVLLLPLLLPVFGEQTSTNSHLSRLTIRTLNGKSYFINFSTMCSSHFLQVCVCCMWMGNGAFSGDKINYKILHNKKLASREREWNEECVSQFLSVLVKWKFITNDKHLCCRSFPITFFKNLHPLTKFPETK